jgi:dGTPase
VRQLFARYFVSPNEMPPEWAHGGEIAEPAARARQVGDFIAGMTDRFALTEHTRMFPKALEASALT